MNEFLIVDELDKQFYTVLYCYNLYDNNLENTHKIIKAYKLAKQLHDGVKRKSGQPYMTHPIEVAKIGVEYNVDCDTICACLLHDTVEDTECTLDYIAQEFNKDVASIVDVVTKITNMDFDSHLNEAELYAKNVRKIFQGLLYRDIRSIAVKLFDRLHNMRTLLYMPREKQINKSKQTLDVFVPLAQAIGANSIKKELQDLCMYYLEPDMFKQLEGQLNQIVISTKDEIEEIKKHISKEMENESIINEMQIRLKNIYNVYISLQKGRSLSTIHDLFALQINVDNIRLCYDTLRIIHASGYPIVPDKLKDYIYMPKTTGYRALHTTLIDQNEQMLQAQIRTKKMALTNTQGILSHLGRYTQEDMVSLKEHYPFFLIGAEIDTNTQSDEEFYEKLRYEILGDKIYVRSSSGKIYEMPVGANIIDFAFLACPNRASYLCEGIVNNQAVDITYQMKNQDLVNFTSSDDLTINAKWLDWCKTTRARRLIRNEIIKKTTF